MDSHITKKLLITMMMLENENLLCQMNIFQEFGLLDGTSITKDGLTVYKLKKYIENGNITPPYTRNFYRLGEYNVILKVIIKLKLARDTVNGPLISRNVLNFIEFIDKSVIDGKEIKSVENISNLKE